MSEAAFPKFFRVRQMLGDRSAEFTNPNLISKRVEEEIRQSALGSNLKKGQRVAIAVGSRGISEISTIVSAVVATVRSLGGHPFVIPAMGSHGGATAEGQAKLLASLGIEQKTIGCPIESSMDTVVVGEFETGVPLHFDRHAYQADHVVLVNRVKPHTRLAGRYESGLIKMLMIGLGKHQGAIFYHKIFPEFDYCLDSLASKIVPQLLVNTKVTAGLAIIEDALDHVAQIKVIDAEQFLEEEPNLLRIAKQNMPSLPFDHADLLIVDQIGKEISGTGMDTNVIGRKQFDKIAAPEEFPKVRQIYVRSLTEKTKGNACGIGIAEYCHDRVLEQMDYETTLINCLTSAHAGAGAIPLHFASDREALTAAVSQSAIKSLPQLKWMRIVDTLHLSEVWCSEAYIEQIKCQPGLETIESDLNLCFDASGNLT